MASGTCGENLTWALSGGRLVIKGKGEMNNYSFKKHSPWYPYKNSPFNKYDIKELVLYNGVTSIGEYAFKDCMDLEEVLLHDSVTSIGKCAFWCCYKLKNIRIPDSVTTIEDYTFWCCKKLTNVAISNNVINIGKQAFKGCGSLKSITIPDNVMTIGEEAFHDCISLKEIHYPAGRGFEKVLSSTSYFSFRSAKLIPYNPATVIKPTPQPVRKPAPQAAVESLRWKVEGKTLTVGGVSEIKSYSYEATPWRDSFRDIQRIIIEEGVKKISANAFAECTRLEQLTIPASVKTIDDGAFTFCYCGDRTINSGRNVIWSLEDGTLMIKKNPAAKNKSNFSTGYETWQVVEGNITGVKIERGIVPANSFFDWLSRMGDGVSVAF